MYMRDLACCAGTSASYSTPSDLVRVGLANDGSVNGELAGGMMMSLMARTDTGIVVAGTVQHRTREHIGAGPEDRGRVCGTGAMSLIHTQSSTAKRGGNSGSKRAANSSGEDRYWRTHARR